MNIPERKLIVLNLTNIVNTDSEVNLLSSPIGSNNSSLNTYYKINFLNTFAYGVRCTFYYTLNGSPLIYDVNGGLGVSDVNDLILGLNTGLGSYALFSYEISTIPNYYTLIIKILNSSFVPTSFEIYN